jgi:hypothetical protein
VTTAAFVLPDVLIDRFVTYAQPAFKSQSSANLFGAQISAQQSGNQLPVIGGEMAPAA